MEKETALKILRDLHNNALFSERTALETLIPELKESEDEKIVKEIINCVKNYGPATANPKLYKDMLSWLEKHIGNDEQKPEPKFKVGDWIISPGGCYLHILDIEKDGYLCKDILGEEIKVLCEHSNSDIKLWTIEDAKDGDALAAHECYVIFKEIDGLNIRCYCTYHYLNSNNFYIDTLQNKTAFQPATKEQRDLLFQKMKEAGYEWDAEKKDLKIIDWSKHIKYEPNGPSIVEEKSAWSEENSCYYDDICEILINLINSPKSKINKDAIQKDLDWLMSIVKSQLNPAWSEEDEDALDIAIRIIQNGGDDCAGILDSDKALKWLKSLKDRVLPQLNQELSDDMTVNEYADLGLPSGTLWKRHNEEKFNDGHDFYENRQRKPMTSVVG